MHPDVSDLCNGITNLVYTFNHKYTRREAEYIMDALQDALDQVQSYTTSESDDDSGGESKGDE